MSTQNTSTQHNKISPLNFAKLQEMLLQDVSKQSRASYVQYTKEQISKYLTNPARNIDSIRDVSNFLMRVSMPYKKIIEYFANMPLYSYNLTCRFDSWDADISPEQYMQGYHDACARLKNIDFKKNMATAVGTALRDGIFTGFCYDDGQHFFMQPLHPKYCKIFSTTELDTYITKFDAEFFNQGNNKNFLYGIDNNKEGVWDKVFIKGYEDYNSKGDEYRWFTLPPERTITIISGDDPSTPLPYFLPIFNSLLDLLDLEALIRDKTELENYVLLLSKIPTLSNTNTVDDFAVSIDLIEATQEMINEGAPSLVWSAYTPCDVEVIRFDNKDQTETNTLAESIHSLFSNAGISEVVFHSDGSNSMSISAGIKGDELVCFNFLAKLQANIQRYINLNISDLFTFKFHQCTYFSQKDYVEDLYQKATAGVPVKLDYATATGDTPYDVMNKTFMEKSLGLADLWQPLNTSFTQSSNQEKDIDELSDEGLKTRDKEKHKTTV